MFDDDPSIDDVLDEDPVEIGLGDDEEQSSEETNGDRDLRPDVPDAQGDGVVDLDDDLERHVLLSQLQTISQARERALNALYVGDEERNAQSTHNPVHSAVRAYGLTVKTIVQQTAAVEGTTDYWTGVEPGSFVISAPDGADSFSVKGIPSDWCTPIYASEDEDLQPQTAPPIDRGPPDSLREQTGSQRTLSQHDLEKIKARSQLQRSVATEAEDREITAVRVEIPHIKGWLTESDIPPEVEWHGTNSGKMIGKPNGTETEIIDPPRDTIEALFNTLENARVAAGIDPASAAAHTGDDTALDLK